jgi:hypothetical protein
MTDVVEYYKLMRDAEFLQRLSKENPLIDVNEQDQFKDEVFQGYHWMGALTALVSQKSVIFVSINGKAVDRCPLVVNHLI